MQDDCDCGYRCVTADVGLKNNWACGWLDRPVDCSYGCDCCDYVCKLVGRLRLWVRLGLQRAVVCEAAALDVRTNYGFKAVGRLNAAVGRLNLRVNRSCCWCLSRPYPRTVILRLRH